MSVLRQSTAVTIKLGPFVDATDGVTAETALTIAQADVRLTKNGGDIAQKSESASATHDELGYYNVALDTTDTNTVGTLRVMVSESGALPVFRDFQIVEEAVYDALFGSGAAGPLLASSTGSTLTAIPWNAAWDAEVQSEVADGLNAYFPTLNANMATVVSQTAATSVRSAVGLASANLDTQLGNIVTDTAEIGAAGAGLTAIPWNASWDAEVQSECADAINQAGVLVANVSYDVTTTNGELATTFAS